MVLRKNCSFNDFKIILIEDIVFAISAILSIASDFFATMLSSDKFVEGETKEVPMKKYGMKKAMEWIWMVLYIYCGDMNVKETGFETMLENMNLSKMMLMKAPPATCPSLAEVESPAITWTWTCR